MERKTNLNVLRWVESLSLQDHRKWWAYGALLPVLTESDTIPPFQLPKPADGADVASLTLVNFKTGAQTDILSNAQASGLELLTFDDYNYDLIVYSGTLRLGVAGIQNTDYYLKMSDGFRTWYSEVFTMCSTVDDLIKIEYWHGEQMVYEGGHIQYNFPYKSRLYLNAEIAHPGYGYEERVVKKEGRNFALQQISFKQFMFMMIANEPFIDAFRVIRMHDFVEISQRGIFYDVDELLMDSPKWGDNAVAEVDVEFRTETVVVVNSRGYEGGPYQPEDFVCVQVSFNCVATLERGSANYNAFQYVNQDGETIALEDDDLIIARDGSSYFVEYFGASSYSVQTVPAGTVARDKNENVYYQAVGSNNVLPPQVNFYDENTQFISGVFLSGATHQIFAVTGGSEVFIGSYSYDELANIGVAITLPEGTEFIRMKIASAACGMFYTADDYELQTPVSGRGIGHDNIGNGQKVY